MNFNPDPAIQAQEIIFRQNTPKQKYYALFFSLMSVIQVKSRKYLGIFLDTQLYFKEHFPNFSNKVKKSYCAP